MTAEKVSNAVSDNYEEFKKFLPSIIDMHRNKFALMRDREVVNYYNSLEDAVSTAYTFFPDGNYSFQKVIFDVEDLGIFSRGMRGG